MNIRCRRLRAVHLAAISTAQTARMSMTDPFLPEQPAHRVPGNDAVEPEDFDHGVENEPDVIVEPPVDEVPVTDDGEPPVEPTVFNTPTGERIDPSQLS